MSQETDEPLGHGQPSGVPFGTAQHKKQGQLNTYEQEACVCRGHGVCAWSMCADSMHVHSLCVRSPCLCRVHVYTGSMQV